MPRGAAVIRYPGKRGTTWRVKYEDADGVQVQETLGPEREGWNRKKAEAELRERLVRVDKDDYRKPSRLTLEAYGKTWLVERTRAHNLRLSSTRAYRLALDHLTSVLGPMPLAAIKPRHVAETRDALLVRGLSNTSVIYDMSVLRDLFQTAIGDELVLRNPVDGVDRPRPVPHDWQAWARQWIDQASTVVPRVAREFTDPRARLIFVTVVNTALRRGELQRLKWGDLTHRTEIENGEASIRTVLRVRESKTEQGRRVIALPRALASELFDYRQQAAYQGDDDYLFASSKGTPFWADWFAAEFREACSKAGVTAPKKPLHDLRHLAITLDAKAGASPFAVMSKAGHTKHSTTARYLHLAGVPFTTEADTLEQHLGGTRLYPSQPTSDDLAALELTEQGAFDPT